MTPQKWMAIAATCFLGGIVLLLMFFGIIRP